MGNKILVPISDLIDAVVEGNEEEFIGKITVAVVASRSDD